MIPLAYIGKPPGWWTRFLNRLGFTATSYCTKCFKPHARGGIDIYAYCYGDKVSCGLREWLPTVE